MNLLGKQTLLSSCCKPPLLTFLCLYQSNSSKCKPSAQSKGITHLIVEPRSGHHYEPTESNSVIETKTLHSLGDDDSANEETTQDATSDEHVNTEDDEPNDELP